MQPQAYSFRDRPDVVFRNAVDALADDRTTEMQLAYEGVWMGHHSGQPIVLDETLIDSWIDQHNRSGERILVDYEHQTELSAMNGMPNPAAGRIGPGGLFKRMGKMGAELWGRVTFTERAAEFIRGDEYDGCSIVIKPVCDRRTGEDLGLQLTSVALTNTPFITGMAPPVLMSRQPHKGTVAMADETMIEEEVSTETDAAMSDGAEDVEIEVDDAGGDEVSASSQFLGALAKLTGIESEEQVIAALSGKIDKIAELLGTQTIAASATAPTRSAPKQSARIVALSAQVTALSASVEKLSTELTVMRDLLPGGKPKPTAEPQTSVAVMLSELNPTQLQHFNNLKNHFGYDEAKAFATVKNNKRMSAQR